MHGYGFHAALFNSELDLRGITDIFKNIPVHMLADRFKDLRVKHSARHDYNKYSYEEMINLDESINLGFFNSLKNL
jgi:hypothetical protein